MQFFNRIEIFRSNGQCFERTVGDKEGKESYIGNIRYDSQFIKLGLVEDMENMKPKGVIVFPMTKVDYFLIEQDVPDKYFQKADDEIYKD